MSDKKYFSYIRVSTQRQGQAGTSLAEQQAAINQFARNWNLPIAKRFAERQSAAKTGRSQFVALMKELRQGKADGVIIHKIDRSARNLKDWADLGALIDNGVEVHFASESLDLNSRGGRLSADIQAVVASDFIRNLREETKKGIYGRLKQGLYPFRAVIGYLDRGPGQPKEIDPVMGPLIGKSFELYATGDWGLPGLMEEMNSLGLRNKQGKEITLNGIATVLHNPFYMGVIRIAKTGESFPGKHRPIVSKRLFDQVQDIFAGRNFKTEKRLFFVFRRLINCKKCRRLMTPEIQKGITYYRCRTKACLDHCLREDKITNELLRLFKKMEFSEAEYQLFRSLADNQSGNFENELRATQFQINLQRSELKKRRSRVADAFVNGVFDELTYIEKKNEIILEEQALDQELGRLSEKTADFTGQLDELCELANSAYLSYESGTPENKRDLVKIICANLSSDGKNVSIKLKIPFQLVADREPFLVGSPCRGGLRTVSALVSQILKLFAQNRFREDEHPLLS